MNAILVSFLLLSACVIVRVVTQGIVPYHGHAQTSPDGKWRVEMYDNPEPFHGSNLLTDFDLGVRVVHTPSARTIIPKFYGKYCRPYLTVWSPDSTKFAAFYLFQHDMEPDVMNQSTFSVKHIGGRVKVEPINDSRVQSMVVEDIPEWFILGLRRECVSDNGIKQEKAREIWFRSFGEEFTETYPFWPVEPLPSTVPRFPTSRI